MRTLYGGGGIVSNSYAQDCTSVKVPAHIATCTRLYQLVRSSCHRVPVTKALQKAMCMGNIVN
jgi:hypothetical protein